MAYNFDRPDGFDVSHHVEPLDWSRAPAVPLYATKAGEGARSVAPRFAAHWEAMRALPFAIYRGAFHWPRADSGPMVGQVEFLRRTIDSVGGLRPGEFVFMDWERTPGVRDLTLGEVEQYVAALGRFFPGRFMVYSAQWLDADNRPGFVHRNMTFTRWRRRHGGVPLWLANYNRADGALDVQTFGADVWQYTDKFTNTGGFARRGIDANLILNRSTLDRITGRFSTMSSGTRLYDSRTNGRMPAGVELRVRLGEPGQTLRLNIAALAIGATGSYVAVYAGARPVNWSTLNTSSGQWLAVEVERTLDETGSLAFYAPHVHEFKVDRVDLVGA